jgi:uncharacterized membrane protein YkvI
MEITYNKNKSIFQFIKETILVVMLWFGLWGIMSLVFYHHLTTFEYQLFGYITIIIVVLCLMNSNNI